MDALDGKDMEAAFNCLGEEEDPLNALLTHEILKDFAPGGSGLAECEALDGKRAHPVEHRESWESDRSKAAVDLGRAAHDAKKGENSREEAQVAAGGFSPTALLPPANLFDAAAGQKVRSSSNQNHFPTIFDLLPSFQGELHHGSALAQHEAAAPIGHHHHLPVYPSHRVHHIPETSLGPIETARVISRPKDQRVVTFSPTTHVIQVPNHLHDRFVTTLGTLDADQGRMKPTGANPAHSESSVKRYHQDILAETSSFQTSMTCAGNAGSVPRTFEGGHRGQGGRKHVIMCLERIIRKFVLNDVSAVPKATPGSGGKGKSTDSGGEKSEDKSINTRDVRYGGHSFKGVTKHRCTGRWEAHIWDKGKQVYLGGFSSSVAAARAYDLVAILCKKNKVLNNGHSLNFPFECYAQYVDEIRLATKDELVSALRRKSCGFARGTSKFRGVTRRSQNGRWEARSASQGSRKYIYLGTFDTEEEAAHEYDRAAIRKDGLNAVTNFDLSEYSEELDALIASKGSISPTSSVSDKSSASSSKRKREKGLKSKERKSIKSPNLGRELANKYLVETSIDDFLIPQLEGKPTLQRSHPASQVDGAKVLGREHANLYNPSLRVGTGNPNDMYYEGLMSDEDLNKRVNSHLQYLI